MPRRALVAVVTDRRIVGIHAFHMVGEKYLRALVVAAGVYPAAIPSFGDDSGVLGILDQVDGLFLPGSPSNIQPAHYDGPPSVPDVWLDPERDRDALKLIPAAVDAGIPMLAVCRGFQEMNVAFGGSLHPLVHEVPDYHLHKENPDDAIDVQYGPSHDVRFSSGGLLESITGQRSASVNSLHSQGIDRLGEGLVMEATADDGLLEAFTVGDARGYTLGVQWHPEWKVEENPVSKAIFRSFGEACEARSMQR
jgi:putative glutamine amidotransferase